MVSARSTELSHAVNDEESFLNSPFVHIFKGRGGVRRRLEGDDVNLDFSVLRDLRDRGCSDYAAMPLTFSDGQIHALTLATDRPGGFATENLGHLHEILPLLSRLVEVHAMRRTARTLLETYLGPNTGRRVLDGLIRRGDGEVIAKDSVTLRSFIVSQRFTWANWSSGRDPWSRSRMAAKPRRFM